MNWRFRQGNDAHVSWTLTDKNGDPYDVTGRDFEVKCSVNGYDVTISDVESSGNVISFMYYGVDQRRIGSHDIKYIENGGKDDMKTFDLLNAFTVVPHTYQEKDLSFGDLDPVEIEVELAVGTKGAQGEPGRDGHDGQDGFSPIVSIIPSTGGYTITITDISGPHTYTVSNGTNGTTPSITADSSGNLYVDGHLLTDVISTTLNTVGDTRYFRLDENGDLTTTPDIKNFYMSGWISSQGASDTLIGACVGLFQNAAALEAAYPDPIVGMFAYVGTEFPADVYACRTAGIWTNTDETFDGGGVTAVDIVDNLVDGGHMKALSAEQGVEIKGLLDEGYVFMGRAYPTDDVSPDRNCFYIASDPGLYFNAVIVNEGEVAYLMWNGHWSKLDTGAIMESELDGFRQEFSDFTDDVQEMMDNYPNITFNGDVTNAPDEEDITMVNDVLKFKDRPSLYGKGYKILRRGVSFSEQVTAADTAYEVRYDFDLGGGTVTLPEGSVLLFKGGKISNGTVNALNSTFEVNGLYQIFDGIEFGNNYFKGCEIIPEYVGAAGDGLTDDTNAMRDCLKISSMGRVVMRIPSGSGYLVTGPINYYNGGFANSFINIKGALPDMKTTNTDTNSALNYGKIIVAEGACLFGDATHTTLSTLRGSISNIAVLGARTLSTNFFMWCNVTTFCMKYCFVCDFGAFCSDSSIKTNCRIHDNHFTSVFYFSRLVDRNLISLIDSAIFNNYINGGANPKEIVSVNACFQFGEYNGSVIRDNFIDFYRTIYEPVRNSNNGPAGNINASGNHYQVFRYFYYMRSGITSMYLNSQHEYFNWNDEAIISSQQQMGDNYMPYVHRTYTGRDSNTYDLPPYIMRTTSGAQNIVIEDVTIENNMDKLIMFHGAPASYKYGRCKFTISNWTDDYGTKYSLPEGGSASNNNGGSYQYKEVETNFICTLESLPALSANTYSTMPYGAKALYDGRIYKATRIRRNGSYVAIWIPEDVNAYVPESGSTANRPTSPTVGEEYFDSTLGKPIWYKGSNVWVDATGTAV